MNIKKKYLMVAIAAAMGTSSATFAAEGDTVQATTQLHFSETQRLSDKQSPDLDMAFKTKLVRLGNGALISVFGDGVNADNIVYDLKKDKERPARDIFIRTCASATADCSVESNWSDPVNVSNTAEMTSVSTDWNGDTDGETTRMPFYGDSDKPNISNGGSNIMITWTDKYCDALPGDVDGTNQRTVTYVERDSREVPFSCTYARYASVNGGGAISWGTDAVQLSDGSRDAKQDVSKINKAGKSVITWQEDPQGLRIGSADGPGDGASGATANHGTDIWFTTTTNTITNAEEGTGKPSGVNTIARLTDNQTKTLTGGHHTIKDAAGTDVDGAQIDSGQTSATRANTALVGSTIVVAYEETKGSEEIETGKYIRYHNFSYTNDPSSAAGQVGCIISNVEENARRIRFMPQTNDQMANVNAVQGDTDSGLRVGLIWKEGKYDQGGPSDIVARLLKKDSEDMASTGLRPEDMVPSVAAGCETSDYAVSSQLLSDASYEPALNLSSNTKTGGNLADTTETNNIENALAHRGAIVGNDLYIGYNYTSDWALANYTTLENYDFWLRHYDGTTDTWGAPKNISNLPTKDINVREPRFVKTPYSDVEEMNYNPNAFIIAWGSQSNVASHIEDAEDLDIYYTRSFDKGETMEPVVKVDNPTGAARFESQLRPTPDGQTVYAVWNEESTDGAVNSVMSMATTGDVTGDDPYADLVESESSSGGSVSVFDGVLLPALLAMLMGVLGFLGLRKKQN